VSTTHPENTFNPTTASPDTIGIVAAVSGFPSNHDALISESVHYGDSETQQFFMRTVFSPGGDTWMDIQSIREGMADIGTQFGMDWQIYDAG